MSNDRNKQAQDVGIDGKEPEKDVIMYGKEQVKDIFKKIWEGEGGEREI